MNTQQKSIKAEQDYVLRKAVKANPEEFPQLCRIFKSMMKKKPCGRKLTLMVGESYSAGMAIIRTRRTGVILISRREIPLMTEQEMQCLIGHEQGHFFGRKENENKPQPGKSLFHMSFPIPLMCLFSHISGQILADIYGVEQCRSAFAAGSHLSEGDSEMEELFNDPCQLLPERFNTCFELAIRIKALGLLNGTEYFYELINSELFGYGHWVMTSEEYFEKINHLFDPYMNFTDEDGKALGTFLGGALFIAGCRVGDVRWYRELELLGYYGEPAALLTFASIDEAYERIKSVADSVRSINHPLKNIAIGVVENAIYQDWADDDAAEKLEDFLSEMFRIDSTAA